MHGSDQVRVTGVEIAGRRVSFERGTTELTLAVTYEGQVLHLALPVSSHPQGGAEELRAAQEALLGFGHALVEAAGFLR